MDFDIIDWDEPDDPGGNVEHIAEHGVSMEDVEEILRRDGPEDRSRSSGRPIRRGMTSTGKYVVVVYEIEEEGGVIVVRPVTAYEITPP